MDNVTRQTYMAAYDSEDDGPCVGCKAEWMENVRNHDSDCLWLAWIQTEELANENDKAWCEDCEKYVDIESEERSSGFTGAPIYFLNKACGHTEVDASADTLDWVR